MSTYKIQVSEQRVGEFSVDASTEREAKHLAEMRYIKEGFSSLEQKNVFFSVEKVVLEAGCYDRR